MSARRDVNRRFLGHEILESRSLLAGLVGDQACSAFQNPLDANDLNADGKVTPSDALVAINNINAGVAGELGVSMAPPALHGVVHDAAAEYLDATGDGRLSAADALAVINTINAGILDRPLANLPTTDQQANWPLAAEPDPEAPAIGTLDVSRGFAKVLAAINSPADTDVYQIAVTKSDLSVSLFSANRVPLTVTLYAVDTSAGGTGSVQELESVTTEAGSRRPARLNADLEVVPGTYYLVVSRPAADPASTEPAPETAAYGLGVLNYNADQYRPITDSELGDDQHDGPDGDPTELPLERRHASARSNIDAAGDQDSFTLELESGKLIVTTRARFPVSVTIDPLDPSLETITGDRRVFANVTAGTYVVTVKAADGTATGAYHMNVVSIPLDDEVPHDPLTALEALFARLDKNDDELLTKEEVKPALPLPAIPILDRVFDNWDTGDDSTLSFTEFEAGFEDLHERAAVHQPVREFVSRIRRR